MKREAKIHEQSMWRNNIEIWCPCSGAGYQTILCCFRIFGLVPTTCGKWFHAGYKRAWAAQTNFLPGFIFKRDVSFIFSRPMTPPEAWVIHARSMTLPEKQVMWRPTHLIQNPKAVAFKPGSRFLVVPDAQSIFPSSANDLICIPIKILWFAVPIIHR